MKKYERPEIETLEFQLVDVLETSDTWKDENVDGEGWI